MLAKEQEETYQTIKEFYGVAEEIVLYVHNGMDCSDYLDVVDKLEMVESLIGDMLNFSEFMTEKYKIIVNEPEYLTDEQKEELEGKIIDLLVSLNVCRDKLTKILA